LAVIERRYPAMEDALYEIEPMRRFAGLDLSDGAIPGETKQVLR
jgi:IS5 family transposase